MCDGSDQRKDSIPPPNFSVSPVDASPPQSKSIELGQMTGGLVASAITMATNSDYYRSKTISGRCLYGGVLEDNLGIPCPRMPIVITDTKGRELGRTMMEGGSFVFHVNDKKAYRIQISSEKYKLRNPLTKDLFIGDQVILEIVNR
jgi:hypothetical protein